MSKDTDFQVVVSKTKFVANASLYFDVPKHG